MKILYFHSDNEAEFLKKKVKDGMIEIKDKIFIPDGKPILLREKFGKITPLYIVKWDALYDGKIESKVKQKIKEEEVKIKCPICKNNIKVKAPVLERNIISTIVTSRDEKFTPEMVYKLLKLKLLGGMLKIRRELRLLPLIFGVIFGVVLVYLLIYLRIIPLG